MYVSRGAALLDLCARGGSMTAEHAVTVYLPDYLWETLQATARATQDTVAEAIVATLAQAFTATPPVLSKPRPGRQHTQPEFGARLRYARQQQGWSSEALSRRAHIDASHIRRLEHHERAPTAHTVGLLARALQLSPDDTATLYHAAGFVGEGVACAS